MAFALLIAVQIFAYLTYPNALAFANKKSTPIELRHQPSGVAAPLEPGRLTT
jgi:hypothetical protein